MTATPRPGSIPCLRSKNWHPPADAAQFWVPWTVKFKWRSLRHFQAFWL